MNLKQFFSRLQFDRKRDGNILFAKNIFYNYPKAWIFVRYQARRAYSYYLKNEYSTQERNALDKAIRQSNIKPLISIVMPTYKSNLKYLRLAINSVYRQTYPHWELCIVDDASNDSRLTQYLTEISTNDSRIKCRFSQVNQHISRTSNIGLEMCTGQFVVLLDHDDELAPLALAYIAKEIIQNPNVKIIYSDEDKLSSKGKRYDPYFKCDWNYELFLGQNLISHLGAYSTDLMRKVGGFREGYEGSQDYDLALRCVEHAGHGEIIHIPKVLYHWRVLPGSTALNIDEKPYAIIAAEKALNDHLHRTNQSGEAKYFHYGYKISYPQLHKTQKVAVFIPAFSESDLSQALELAKRLLTFSTIGEIVVLHSLHQADLKVANISNLSYRPLSSQYQGHITSSADLVALRSMALHESPLNNRLLLSSDASFAGEDWLFEMLAQISKQAVVAVSNAGFDNSGHFICGPKIINKSHQAITPFVGLLERQVGYGGRNQLTQQLSALDLDCLLINTDLIKIDVSAWDAIENTLEFFLKLRSNDLKLIWAPASKIYFTSPHRVSGTKPKETKDSIYSSVLVNPFIDEFYSTNFLDGPYCFIIDYRLKAKSLEALKILPKQSSHV
jgi:glycosyltransferase involved in cell wall biosynthesis